MRAIAAEVGVQAALYNYTPDKQSLLFDLMQAHMTDLLAETPHNPSRPAMQQLQDARGLPYPFSRGSARGFSSPIWSCAI